MNQIQIGGGLAAVAQMGGSPGIPVVSNLVLSQSATTIVATWTTQSASDSQLYCGLMVGDYTISAVDNGVQTGSFQHQAILAGLSPSTTYHCQATSTNVAGTGSATASISTAAVATSTQLTGVSYGAIELYNSSFSGFSMIGDTFYNCQAADGNLYYLTSDTTGYSGGGSPTIASATQVEKFIGTFPSPGFTVNGMSGYGANSQPLSPSGGSFKSAGIFAMQGKQFMTEGRQTSVSGSNFYFAQTQGGMLWTPDNWQTTNNWQAPTVFTANGVPSTAPMFNADGTWPSDFASAAFIMGGPDDGTLGYLVSANRTDNRDAYVYLVSNEHMWNNGSNYYLARVSRAKMALLDAGDYQFYKGGDGNLDASWGVGADMVPILTLANELSEPNVVYIPALNRYIMLGFYYQNFDLFPGTGYAANSNFPVWEAQYPWGPWTLISNENFPTQGYYNPIILQPTIQSGSTPTILFAGDFEVGGIPYQMHWTTMTINT